MREYTNPAAKLSCSPGAPRRPARSAQLSLSSNFSWACLLISSACPEGGREGRSAEAQDPTPRQSSPCSTTEPSSRHSVGTMCCHRHLAVHSWEEDPLEASGVAGAWIRASLASPHLVRTPAPPAPRLPKASARSLPPSHTRPPSYLADEPRDQQEHQDAVVVPAVPQEAVRHEGGEEGDVAVGLLHLHLAQLHLDGLQGVWGKGGSQGAPALAPPRGRGIAWPGANSEASHTGSRHFPQNSLLRGNRTGESHTAWKAPTAPCRASAPGAGLRMASSSPAEHRLSGPPTFQPPHPLKGTGMRSLLPSGAPPPLAAPPASANGRPPSRQS